MSCEYQGRDQGDASTSQGTHASEVAQSCPALCDPTDYSLPGFSIHGIFQSRLPFPSPGDLPDPGIEPRSPTWQADALPSEPPGKPNRIPVELFQILKDDAVKGLHSICWQIWKTQQWPQDWERSVFSPLPKKK